ncbi:MAG: adenylate/guanylate cyclase domain-containing protein [Candidatus Polarisedimenticolaceae bacterium]|nr:adenylate/guanylate cyclase domain-containing protein [Candidatus Polarisedimenticolaceae bacterium]
MLLSASKLSPPDGSFDARTMTPVISPSAPQQRTERASASDSNLRTRYRNSRLPIVAKWSLAIGVLVTSVMGLLSWILITQQSRSFMQQTEDFGLILVNQLAHFASEPIMADDNFMLTGLVNRQVKSKQILGALIHQGERTLATAGLSLPTTLFDQVMQSKLDQVTWSWQDDAGKTHQAITFTTEIQFKDVTPGLALITLDRNQLNAQQHKAMTVLAYSTLGLILLGIFLAYALSHRLSRPIKALAQAGASISRGEQIDGVDRERQDEIGHIITTFNLMVDGIRERERIEQALSSYVSPHAVQRVLANLEEPSEAGEELFGSVLFCDIVGYTQLTEGMSPKAVAEMLNEYLGYIALAGHSCHGMVDKFIGDCVMIVFGAPEHDAQHALHAVTCGVMIQEIVQHINQRRQQQRLHPLLFRIGINSGIMMAGNIGTQERMQYTVVGDSVNLSARLCSLAPPGMILIGAETAKQSEVAEKAQLDQQPPVRVKGRTQPVTPYIVHAMKSEYQQQVRQTMDRLLPAKSAA